MTASLIRQAILRRLQAGDATHAALMDAAHATETSTWRALRAMTEDGAVVRAGEAYRLTGAGRIEAALCASMTKGLAAMDAYRAFWSGHDVSDIPPELLARIGELGQCDLVTGTPSSEFHCQEYFISEMLKSKVMYGVSPIIIPGHIEMMDALIQKGAEVELIITPSVVRALGSKLSQWQKCGAKFYEIPDARAAFSVTEGMLSLGLYGMDGRYDILSDLDCYGPGSVRWGRDLYRHYRDLAKPL